MSKRTHIVLPVDVVAEIQRRQQQIALRAAMGAWKDENHPELKAGAAAWVRQMRSETEERLKDIEKHRNRS